ncbi:hypothetical protein MBLNU230_g7566t1 [Neophaeotheca triangularis]
MPKERSANPAAAQHKADKAKAIAKNKKNVQAQRNERLGQRNPNRIQRQIEELKESEQSGRIRPQEKELLTKLEKDLRAINKAREALGDAAPKFPTNESRKDGANSREAPNLRQQQIERRQQLGKRRRDDDEATATASGDETDPEVRAIPMPRDTPPPIPRPEQPTSTSHALPPKPGAVPPQAKKIYSSAPKLRDFQKEAARFVPTSIAQQKARNKAASGRLMEPEEADRVEQSGKDAAEKAAKAADEEARLERERAQVKAQGQLGDGLDEEYAKFEQEIGGIYPAGEERKGPRPVAVEDVADEG